MHPRVLIQWVFKRLNPADLKFPTYPLHLTRFLLWIIVTLQDICTSTIMEFSSLHLRNPVKLDVRNFPAIAELLKDPAFYQKRSFHLKFMCIST